MNSPRLHPIDPATATGSNQDFFKALQTRLGLIPNLARTLAQSPAALEGYLSLGGALGKGTLTGQVREQLALAVAAANSCHYSASAHSVIGQLAGLDQAQIDSALTGHAADPKSEAALAFARLLVATRGEATDAEVQAVRDAGYTEGEVAEIVGHVALNTFANYFNKVARTEIDFPRVELPKTA